MSVVAATFAPLSDTIIIPFEIIAAVIVVAPLFMELTSGHTNDSGVDAWKPLVARTLPERVTTPLELIAPEPRLTAPVVTVSAFEAVSSPADVIDPLPVVARLPLVEMFPDDDTVPPPRFTAPVVTVSALDAVSSPADVIAPLPVAEILPLVVMFPDDDTVPPPRFTAPVVTVSALEAVSSPLDVIVAPPVVWIFFALVVVPVPVGVRTILALNPAVVEIAKLAPDVVAVILSVSSVLPDATVTTLVPAGVSIILPLVTVDKLRSLVGVVEDIISTVSVLPDWTTTPPAAVGLRAMEPVPVDDKVKFPVVFGCRVFEYRFVPM